MAGAPGSRVLPLIEMGVKDAIVAIGSVDRNLEGGLARNLNVRVRVAGGRVGF